MDLSNTDYSVKLALYDNRSTASAVMKDKKAIVTMNAGYERESIVIRENGRTAYMMPNATIGTTGVPNWKNEGCVILDGKRDVRFEATGRDLSYQDQKRAYMKLAPTEESEPPLQRPVLIYDYEPRGRLSAPAIPSSSPTRKILMSTRVRIPIPAPSSPGMSSIISCSWSSTGVAPA